MTIRISGIEWNSNESGRRILLLLCITLFFCSHRSYGDINAPASSHFEFCRYLASRNEVNLAGLEMERFLASGTLDSVHALNFLGNLYLDTDALKATGYFERAIKLSTGASPGQGVAVAGLARSSLLQSKPLVARYHIDQYFQRNPDKRNDPSFLFLKSLVDAELYEFDSAQNSCNAIPPESGIHEKVDELDTLMQWFTQQDMKDQHKAYTYSSILPGLGHWYLGEKKKAVYSFSLMAVLSGVLAWEGYRFYRGDRRQRYVSGMNFILVDLFIWQRYYIGIRKAAYDRALEKNETVHGTFKAGLRRILSDDKTKKDIVNR